MHTNPIKKGLAVGIILLFIGVAVAPSINSSVVKTSDDLIEVTSQACGIQGFGNTTAKLTKEQYHDLEQYLVDFRAKLNQTTSREEAVPIFNDAVVELNKYGLLPKGMSIEQAQKLVTSQNQAKHVEDFQMKIAHNPLLRYENDSNFLCLIAGYTFNSIVVGGLTWTLFTSAALSFMLYNYLVPPVPWFPGAILLGIFFLILAPILGVLGLCSLPLLFSPIKLLSMIRIGGGGPIRPETGWIATFGLNGVVKYFSNEMYGQWSFLIGAVGFTGISLLTPNAPNYPYSPISFFLGGALAVKIGPNPPYIK